MYARKALTLHALWFEVCKRTNDGDSPHEWIGEHGVVCVGPTVRSYMQRVYGMFFVFVLGTIR